MHRELFKRKYDELRRQAEHSLANGKADRYVPESADVTTLQHEVSVQHVELEMQHDELLKAHHDLGELRLRAEHKREQYQQLFNLAPVGMVVLDVRGVIVKCNRAFSTMVGHGEHAPEGRTLAEFVAPQDRMNFDILYKQELNNRAGNAIDFKLTDKKGGDTAVRLRVAPLENGSLQDQEYLVALSEYRT